MNINYIIIVIIVIILIKSKRIGKNECNKH